jgi:methionyl-tRNA synthetase
VSRFYVTTPIYYVNDVPHVGHAYTTVAADTLARWHRLNGRTVRFLTGTDEHGQKVARAAAKLGRTPQAHVDALYGNFQALWERLDCRYDDFIRTTEPRHVEVVRSFLQQLWERGEIYAKDYSGWYSTSAERFWSTEEVTPAGASPADVESGRVPGVCPDTGQAVEWLTERNYFFKMSAYQERLLAHIAEHPESIRPEMRRNEVLGYLKKPLGDLCISRPKARLSWGIPLPFDEDYVTYVWFDALSNYVSALGEDRAAWWPADLHIVGKDILTFHTVYWFSMLMALGLEPPKCVYAHGWWTVRRAKMSKSAGNMVDPNALIDRYGPDALRYFLLREIPFGGDGDYSPEAFLVRYNADLANDLGNLAHRSLSMAEKWLGGELPAAGPPTPADEAFLALGQTAVATFREQIEGYQFKQALEGLWDFVRAGNKYLDTEAPWTLARKGETARLAAVLRNALECVRVAASHLACVCPSKSAALLQKLGLSSPDLSVSLQALPAGARVAAGEPLFPRIEAEPEPAEKESIVSEVAPAAPVPAAPEAPAFEPIDYADFAKIQLKVGKILTAERVPKADKLLKLSVDVGEAVPRTILAGIAKSHTPESLVGQQVTVVANLKPRVMRGIESQGMLLAAGGEDVAALVAPGIAIAPGTGVK